MAYLMLLIYIPVAIYLVGILAGFVYRKMSGKCSSKAKMYGKTIIITGATAGIGKTAAIDLAQRGGRIILACRNKEKAETVRNEIVLLTKNNNVLVKIVDTSDLDSVRKFCNDILETETKIDVLINNAGVGTPKKKLSAQGHELTLATNHYGHFLLTNMLLGLLKKSAPSRIINVTSLSHHHSGFDIDDLHFEKRPYHYYKAYAQSKFCNVLFTKHLDKLLSGSGVTANCLHPGVVHTEIATKYGSLVGKIIGIVSEIIFKDAMLGAQTTIHLAVSEDVANVSGEYFVDCKIAPMNKKAYDQDMAQNFWNISELETKLTRNEKNY